MDIIAIMNTIRAQNSQQYQQRVPELTQNNLDRVGSAIMEYENTQNEYLDALINRVAFVEVSNRRYQNKLAILKSGGKPYGTDIEEIYTNPVSAVNFNGSTGADDMLKVTKPDTKTIFHRMNRQDKYPVSISSAMLQKAFTSFSELTSFVTSIIDAMYSGDEMDEFILMRNIITDAIADGKMKVMTVDYDGGETTAKDLVKLIKTLSGDFEFPDTAFNGYNELNKAAIEAGTLTACTTWTPKENQVFLVRTDVDAATDVEVLAKAFNMDKTDFLKRKIVVNNFGDADTLCAIVDEKVIKVYDDLYQVRSFDNGSNLTTNYWLHHWQTISMSLFGNAVAIKKTPAAE